MIGEGLRRRQEDEPSGWGMMVLAAAGWALFLLALLLLANARRDVRLQAAALEQRSREFTEYREHVERQTTLALQEMQLVNVALQQCEAQRRTSGLVGLLQAILR